MRALCLCAHNSSVCVLGRWQAVHKVMRMAVLCKQNSEPVHATNLHAVNSQLRWQEGGREEEEEEEELYICD